jgi:hypothetical protein
MTKFKGIADNSRQRIYELHEYAASIFRQSVLPICPASAPLGPKW